MLQAITELLRNGSANVGKRVGTFLVFTLSLPSFHLVFLQTSTCILIGHALVSSLFEAGNLHKILLIFWVSFEIIRTKLLFFFSSCYSFWTRKHFCNFFYRHTIFFWPKKVVLMPSLGKIGKQRAKQLFFGEKAFCLLFKTCQWTFPLFTKVVFYIFTAESSSICGASLYCYLIFAQLKLECSSKSGEKRPYE